MGKVFHGLEYTEILDCAVCSLPASTWLQFVVLVARKSSILWSHLYPEKREQTQRRIVLFLGDMRTRFWTELRRVRLFLQSQEQQVNRSSSLLAFSNQSRNCYACFWNNWTSCSVYFWFWFHQRAATEVNRISAPSVSPNILVSNTEGGADLSSSQYVLRHLFLGNTTVSR